MPFIAWLTKCIGSWVQFIGKSSASDPICQNTAPGLAGPRITGSAIYLKDSGFDDFGVDVTISR
ncbi:MAG: hypothetical protein DMG13_07285 [Acidobacteria bacterium]|nr:MAG: hypothetical protein DMG13_07285 [Acidobacteriota bacterium]